MIASRRSTKMRVVCILEFVLVLNLTEIWRSEVWGVGTDLHVKASKLIFNLSRQNNDVKIERRLFSATTGVHSESCVERFIHWRTPRNFQNENLTSSY